MKSHEPKNLKPIVLRKKIRSRNILTPQILTEAVEDSKGARFLDNYFSSTKQC